MYYFLILFILLLLFVSLAFEGEQRKKIENVGSILIWGLIVLLAAIRSSSVGADTASYMEDYQVIPLYSVGEILQQWHGYSGYYILSKLFASIGAPVQVWFAFIQLLNVFSLNLLIKKFSKSQIFSVLIFVTVGLFTFSMAGLKQTMAISFMILSFVAFVNKRYIITIPLALFGIFCHSVGLIILPVFILYLIRDKKYFYPLLFATVIIGLIFREPLLKEAVSFLGDEHYELYLDNEQSYSSTQLIFIVTLLLLARLEAKSYIASSKSESRLLFGLCLISCSLQVLASYSPSLFRLSYCYLPFFTLYIPNVVESMPAGRAKIVRLMFIIIVSFFFLYVNRNSVYSINSL